MPTSASTSFSPVFEFQGWDWVYQSFLILPTPAEATAAPGSSVTAKKWAMGRLVIADNPAGSNIIGGYDGGGFLEFAVGVKLRVAVKGLDGIDETPATFEAIGKGEEGVTKGAEYQLSGWAFRGSDGKLESIHGSVRAVRGPDSNPKFELGKMPVGTVGAFMIVRGTP